MKKLTTKEFIEQARIAHGDKYDYSKVEYVNAQTKVCIICPIHWEFWQAPKDHLKGNGCSICKSSHLETSVATMLEENGIMFEPQKTFEWLKHVGKLRLDFYLPEYNIGIECQGGQHFSYKDESFFTKDIVEKIQIRDINKNKLCKEHGMKMLYITDDKFNFSKMQRENEHLDFYTRKNTFRFNKFNIKEHIS